MCRATCRFKKRAQHADGGGLARAVRAKQAKYLAAFDLDIDSVHGGEHGFGLFLPKLPALLF